MTTGTALKISKGHMWRSNIEDKPGMLAKSLEPFAKAGHSLQIVAACAPSAGAEKQTATMEIFPITDEKGKQCAKEAGLQEMKDIVCLIVEGQDSPGLGYRMAKIIAEAGVNVRYAMCQSIKQSFVACFGFQSDNDAEKAKSALARL